MSVVEWERFICCNRQRRNIPQELRRFKNKALYIGQVPLARVEGSDASETAVDGESIRHYYGIQYCFEDDAFENLADDPSTTTSMKPHGTGQD